MVYKRYIMRDGKKIGPYYYKSVRDKRGRVRNIYVGRAPPEESPAPRQTFSHSGPRHIFPEPRKGDMPFILAAVAVVIMLFAVYLTGFSFTGLTVYSYSSNSNLTGWDETDSGMPYAGNARYPTNITYFFANYTNSTSGENITGECKISFEGSVDNAMLFNATKKLYEYSRNFSGKDIYPYNITCTAVNFDALNGSDSVNISSLRTNNYVCSNISQCEYQTITSALLGENNTANGILLKDPGTTYTITKSGKYLNTGSSGYTIGLEGHNIILDCNWAEISGPSGAVVISSRYQNNTIKNCIISGANYGIALDVGPSYSGFNNVTSNILYDVSTSMIISSYTNHVWLNKFLDGNLQLYGGNLSFCVGGEGNFYEQSITPTTGDCGQVNVTSPKHREIIKQGTFYQINWTRQSSTSDVEYDLFAVNTSNREETYIDSTYETYYEINTTGVPYGKYSIKIVPWIVFNGSRINGKDAFSGNFSIITGDADSDGDPDETDCAPTNPFILSPRDDLVITKSIKLCPGNYTIPDRDMAGVLIFNASKVTLDCNGAGIYGDGVGIGVLNTGSFNETAFDNYGVDTEDILTLALELLAYCSGIDPSNVSNERVKSLMSNGTAVDCLMGLAVNLTVLKRGNTIKNCDIVDYKMGIVSNLSTGTSIYNNRVGFGDVGIASLFTNGTRVYKNLVGGSKTGILAAGFFWSSANNNTILHTDIAMQAFITYVANFSGNNLTSSEYGIQAPSLLLSSLVSDNKIKNCEAGIAIGGLSFYNTISKNSVINSSLAGFVMLDTLIFWNGAPSAMNTITQNNFNSTASGAYDIGRGDEDRCKVTNNSFYLNNILGKGVYGDEISNYSEYEDNSSWGCINFYCNPNTEDGGGNYYATSVPGNATVVGPCGALPHTFEYYDQDGDGYSILSPPYDCNDDNARVYPNASEICDSRDNDCDGRVDEGCTSESKKGGGAGASPMFDVLLETEDQVTYNITKKPTEVSSTKLWDLKFRAEGKNHTLKLNKLYEDKAEITISSTPVTAMIRLGEELLLDLNDDSYREFSIKLGNILGNRAIFIMKLVEKAEQPLVPGEERPILAPNKTQEIVNETGAIAEKPAASGSSILLLIILLFVVAIFSYGGVMVYCRLQDINRVEEYITAALDKKVPPNQIKERLLKEGWPEDAIDKVLGMNK